MIARDPVASLRAALDAQLSPTALTIEDEGAAHVGHAGAREGGHFRVVVVSERFRGQPLLERHRLVYEAARPLMGQGIHALAIVARTPEEHAS